MKLSRVMHHALLYGTSIALMKGVSLLMLPFIAQQLSADDFGRLEVAGSLAVIGSIMIGLGLEDSLYRFAGAHNEQHARRRVAAVIYTLTLFAAAIVIPLAWLLAAPLSSWLPGQLSSYEVTLVLSLLALEGAIAVPLGWLRMRDQALSFFTLTTGRAGLQALLTLLLLSEGRQVAGVLEAGVISALLQALLLAWLQLRDSGIGIDKIIIRQALVYGLPLVASGLLAFSISGLDRWIIADQVSLADAAHFGIAAKFALATVLLLQPYGMWWMPKRFEVLFGEGGAERTAYFNSLGIALAVIMTVAVGLAAPLMIDWLMPLEYAPAAGYAVVLVAAAGLKEISELVSISCLAGKTTGTQVGINALSAGCAVVLMLSLAPLYGTWGVCWSLLAAQLVRLLAFALIGQQLHALPYPSAALLLLTAVATATLLWSDHRQIDAAYFLLSAASLALVLFSALALKLLPLPLISKAGEDSKVSGVTRWT